MDGNYVTPADHVGFSCRVLLSRQEGAPVDCALAFVDPQGGGPERPHTHMHSHVFVVIEGTAMIQIGDETVTVRKDEALFVPGTVAHSVWNHGEGPMKMIGLNLPGKPLTL